ncbi:hypothetical protein GCM10020000_27620 [Streptomyces olivoverticillatus]
MTPGPPGEGKAAGESPGRGAYKCEGGEVHIDKVSGDEPLLPARVHRPADLVRLFLGIVGIALVLALAAFAHGTTQGLEKDIGESTGRAPQLLANFAGLAANIAIFIVPVAFAIERLVKRDGLRIADGVLAAVLAHGVSLATDLWVADTAPRLDPRRPHPDLPERRRHRSGARLSGACHRLYDGRRHVAPPPAGGWRCGRCCCSTRSPCWSTATPRRSPSPPPC